LHLNYGYCKAPEKNTDRLLQQVFNVPQSCILVLISEKKNVYKVIADLLITLHLLF